MSSEELISVELYCRHEELDITFVHSLEERGLIQVVRREERIYLLPEQLGQLERLARLHFDLDINLEGLEAINHMLERMEHMQGLVRSLQERLRLYEEEQ